MATETTKLTYVEGAAASTPAAGRVVQYAKADGLFYSKDDAGTETLMSAGGAGIPATILDAKGDIIAATAADTASRLAVGANGTVLTAASGEATGLKYGPGPTFVAIIQDQKSSGTAGGTFTLGAWRLRDLNTEVSDAASIVTIATNQFTPIAGIYRAVIRAPGRAVSEHQARLWNATAAALVATGSSSFAPTSVQTDSIIDTVFTANGTDAYQVEHQSAATTATTGFGVPGSFGTEVYTSVVLMKIG